MKKPTSYRITQTNSTRAMSAYTRAARIHVAFHREIDKVVSVGCTGVPAHVERLIAERSRYVAASEAIERSFNAWGV